MRPCCRELDTPDCHCPKTVEFIDPETNEIVGETSYAGSWLCSQDPHCGGCANCLIMQAEHSGLKVNYVH